MAMRSREVRLERRPNGSPVRDDFSFGEVDLPDPGPGEVQVRNLWMAMDPAMRGRMSEARSYVPPFELGKAMEGPAVGEVVASNDPNFVPGDLVWSRLGWREGFTAPANKVEKRSRDLPPQAYLGFAGMTGLTAYVGLLHSAALKPGDTVFVSAASGGVGSVVCQIAKLKGHKVIGAAGGERKKRYLLDVLKLDGAIDYKAEPSLTKALAREAPEGIDVYFDNVGGEHLQAALAIANKYARFALCGMISQYNSTEPSAAPRNLTAAVTKELTLQGFIALNHLDKMDAFLADVRAWHAAGLLTPAETVYEGLDRSLEAFDGLFDGSGLGKMLVKIA
nr:NADP-dependent oxidoreductase [Sphingomonas montanisoli]